MTVPPVIYDQASADQRTAARNIAAEVRGVEEAHLCRWDGHQFVVRSDSGPRTYELSVSASVPDHRLVISCSCPAQRSQVSAGQLGCKHRALVARRLERMGFARFDGVRWVVVVEDLLAAAGSGGEDQ